MIKEEVIVALQQIDAKMLSKMFLAGAKNLENNIYVEGVRAID